MIKHTEEFKREAVRIALTSGLPRDRVASDLGIWDEAWSRPARIPDTSKCIYSDEIF